MGCFRPVLKGAEMITVRIDCKTHLGPLDELPAQMATRIRDRLTFLNPAYQEAERRGFSTWNIAQAMTGCQQEGDSLDIPRGFTRQLLGMLKKSGVRCRTEDNRQTLPR